MRISRVVTAAAVIFSTAAATSLATAADLPVPAPVYTKAPVVSTPAYDWSGFYIGGHLGYIWGASRVSDNGVLTEAHAPTDGVVGGLLAGYNWQSGPLVLGIEGDFGWSDATGHGTAPTPPPPLLPREPNTYHLRWDSHVVGKLGLASDRWLIFATGGVAIAGFSFQEEIVPPAPPANRVSETYVGFSVGAGAEYALTQNLLGRLQYIYDDFGSKNYTALDGGIYRVKLTGQTVRGALFWKF